MIHALVGPRLRRKNSWIKYEKQFRKVILSLRTLPHGEEHRIPMYAKGVNEATRIAGSVCFTQVRLVWIVWWHGGMIDTFRSHHGLVQEHGTLTGRIETESSFRPLP